MLVALLSSLEPAGEGATCPRAFLKIAGRSVIERQVDLALALRCERVICVAAGITPEILAAQRVAEREGRQFHAVRSIEALRVQVSAADELLVIADGVLPDADLLGAAFAQRRGVAAFPADMALAHGFERIDAGQAWAGALRCSGGDLERLADLPADIDPLSALMRATLQTGRAIVPIPAEALAEGRWPLIDTAQKARSAGRRTVERRFVPAPWSAPLNAAADRITGMQADRLLRGGGSGVWLLGGGALLALGGLVTTGAGYLTAGLGLLGLAAALIRGWRGLAIMREAPPGWTTAAPMLVWDAALLAAVFAYVGTAGWNDVLFPLLVLLGLLHGAATMAAGGLRAAMEDRMALALLLAVAASQMVLSGMVQALCLALVAVCILIARQVQLTRA